MYAKIFASLWHGSLATNWEGWSVFVYMLANANAEGRFDRTPESISLSTGIPLEAVERGLRVLEQPDRRSRSEAEGGRRIKRLDDHRDWGWQIVNYGLYRASIDADERRRQGRERQAKWRATHCETKNVTQSNAPSRTVTTSIEHRAEAKAEADTEAEAPRKNLPALKESPKAPTTYGEPFLELPTNLRGQMRIVTIEEVAELEERYPAVNVRQQLRNMQGWLDSNPVNRKTASGMKRFMNGWLAKEQNRSHSNGAAKPGHVTSSQMMQKAQRLREEQDGTN